MLRKARIGDVRAIHRMINQSSQKGEMLPRSLMDIYGNLRDFFVYYDKDEHSIIGICAMSIIWENLAEIGLSMSRMTTAVRGLPKNWWRPAFQKPSLWSCFASSP